MPKKKRFSDTDRQKRTDFRFLIYTPKNIYLKKTFLKCQFTRKIRLKKMEIYKFV